MSKTAMENPERALDISKLRRPRWSWRKRLGCGLLILLILLTPLFAVAGGMGWRHYRVCTRLAETLAELDRSEPGWRLNELEAARAPIPEEENSARVLVAAVALLPKQWPTPILLEPYEHLEPQEQLAAEEFARLKKELDKARPALPLAHKLADLPRGRHRIAYERNPLNTMLGDQGEGRRVARLLFLDAVRWNQEGNSQNALISCRAILNAALAVGDEPLMVSQLVRSAESRRACSAVERTLAQGEPPAAETIALQKLLEQEDAFPDLLICARSERAANHELFEAVESGEVTFAQLPLEQNLQAEPLFAFQRRDDVRAEHPLLLARMNRWVAIAQLPMHEQAEAESEFVREIAYLPKSAVLTTWRQPAINKVGGDSRRKHACLRCTLVALAAERYRQAHKAWPASIGKLCPQYLKSVPLDPFDGRPLRYRRVGEGAVVYSVGHDGIDDGGKFDPERPLKRGVDMGCRLWDVAKRRQRPKPKPQPPVFIQPPGMRQPDPNIG